MVLLPKKEDKEELSKALGRGREKSSRGEKI